MLDLPPINHAKVSESTLTTPRAHRIMQEHRHCPISVCAAKAQARQKLIAAGKLVPADAPHIGS
ncbi:hypothetical protein [Nocardia sp. IFM 10818]